MKTKSILKLLALASALFFVAPATQAAVMKLTILGKVSVDTGLGLGRLKTMADAFAKAGVNIQGEIPAKPTKVEVTFIRCEPGIPVKTVRLLHALDSLGYRPASFEEAASNDMSERFAGQPVLALGTTFALPESSGLYFVIQYGAKGSGQGASYQPVKRKTNAPWEGTVILAAVELKR